MTKEQFLTQLQDQLSVLPPEESSELMEDYAAHFAFGLQNGKTEQEISRELGNPLELAQEAIRERNAASEHVYWSNPAVAHPGFADNQASQPFTSTSHPQTKRRGGVATVFIISGLVLLNLIVVPLLLSLWLTVIGFALSAFGFVLSPVLVLLDYAFGHGFYPAKAFASVSLIGVGILLGLGTKYLFKGMLSLSLSYGKWNKRVIGGGRTYE